MSRMADISWLDNIVFKSRTGQPTISDVAGPVRLLVGWLEKPTNRNRFGALIDLQLVCFEVNLINQVTS